MRTRIAIGDYLVIYEPDRDLYVVVDVRDDKECGAFLLLNDATDWVFGPH